MATPHSSLTAVLALISGAYLLASAAGMLIPGAAKAMVEDMRAHPASAHAVGAVAFFVGAGLVAAASRDTGLLAWALGAAGGWWLLEGAAMLAAPSLILSRPDGGVHLRRMNLFAIPAGLVLLGLSVSRLWEVLP